MGKRIFLIFGVLVVAIYLGSLVVGAARQVGVNQGYEPDQPIAFSHKTHAGDNQVSCLYCHTGAEKGRHAGVPSLNLCMNCHTQIKKDSPEIGKIKQALESGKNIEWIKVHRLPDHAYFNHSQHVTGGVSCQSCHGAVESMTRMKQSQPLTMGWCISCHRERGIVPPNTRSPEEARNLTTRPPLIGGTDCSKCHY